MVDAGLVRSCWCSVSMAGLGVGLGPQVGSVVLVRLVVVMLCWQQQVRRSSTEAIVVRALYIGQGWAGRPVCGVNWCGGAGGAVWCASRCGVAEWWCVRGGDCDCGWPALGVMCWGLEVLVGGWVTSFVSARMRTLCR